jgi:two-component system cell cycle sensor histidine kinase/response regulator CckA
MGKQCDPKTATARELHGDFAGYGSLSALMRRLCSPTEGQQDDAALLQMQRTMLVGLVASSYIHDLNNLLTIVQGSASMAAEDLPPDHPVQDSLSAISHAGRSASALSRRLMAFLNRQPVAARRVILQKLLAEWTPLLERLLGSTFRLSVTFPADLWNVYADPVQIEQLLINLLQNARDAMPSGGPIEVAWRNIRLDRADDLPPGDYVCCDVRDSGTGMAPEVLGRLFEPFFSAKSPARGTGLGLAICHHIVTGLGGAIRVQSTPGAGSTFSIYLPRHNA